MYVRMYIHKYTAGLSDSAFSTITIATAAIDTIFDSLFTINGLVKWICEVLNTKTSCILIADKMDFDVKF